MKSTDNPSLIETVIASGADASYVRTIPKTQTQSGSGEMSLALGWPPECAIPVAAGGKYPQMADANGVLNLLSAAVQQLQARFFGAYNADFATAIGGYPLNAIVSDTTAGKFWVSTAEDNTTAPGSDGASWQSLFNGYATQAQSDARYLMLASTALQTVSGPVTFSGTTLVPPIADWTQPQALGAADAEGRYIRSPYNPATDYRIQTISRNKVSGDIFVFAEDDSNTQLQPAGDYATNTALNNEVTARVNAVAGLDAAKVNRGGDTMEWLNTNGSVVATNQPSTTTSGQMNFGPSFQCQTNGRSMAAFFVQENVGNTTDGVLRVGYAGEWLGYYWFNQSGRLNSNLGPYALTSDLPLSAGQKIFIFTATVTDTQDIALPQAMSNVLFVTAQGGTDGKGTGMTTVNSWTNSTVNVTVASYHTGAPQRATITQTFLVIAIP